MYCTASFRPSWACVGGRYVISTCLPIDGPAPADVTYDRRPCESAIGVPSASTTGSRPSGEGLTPERGGVALDPGARRVIVDRERAELRDGLRIAVPQVRVLADEVLALHLPPGHVGLDNRVIRVELEAERAVRLLEAAGRAVDTDPGGD